MTQKQIHQQAQPPTFDLDLLDGDIVVGSLTPSTVAFHGFATEAEAMHASWVGHRFLARRVAKREGRRPIPIDIEPLALKADDSVHASGARIATLIRPDPSGERGDGSFGFALSFPQPMDEVGARAKALLVYRTLRRSGVRWSMWLTARPTKGTEAKASVQADSRSASPAPRSEPIIPLPIGLMAGLSIVLLVLALITPVQIAITFAVGGLAGLFVLRMLALTDRYSPRALVRRA